MKLNSKSFYLMIAAIGIAIAMLVAGLVHTCVLVSTNYIETLVDEILKIYSAVLDDTTQIIVVDMLRLMMSSIKTMTIVLSALQLVVYGGLLVWAITILIKHRQGKYTKKGVYLIVILVFAIIWLVSNGSSLISLLLAPELFSAITIPLYIAASVLYIVGFYLYKKQKEKYLFAQRVREHEQQAQKLDPYGNTYNPPFGQSQSQFNNENNNQHHQ